MFEKTQTSDFFFLLKNLHKIKTQLINDEKRCKHGCRNVDNVFEKKNKKKTQIFVKSWKFFKKL